MMQEISDMNGNSFVDTLTRLGYPGASTLDAQGFDWMFENQQLQPFLDWFCCNVQKENVLSQQELQDFEELESSGEAILEGTQLQDALSSLSTAEDEEETEDKLRADIAQLTDDLELAQKKKCMLLAQRNKLSLHLTGLNYKVTQVGNLLTGAKQEYRKCLEQSHTDNSKMNSSLCDLKSVVKKLDSVYQTSTIGTTGGSTFLSQAIFDDYHHTEEKFTQELTTFTKKKFFEGIAEVAGQTDTSKYEFLDISNPDSSSVIRENKLDNYRTKCKELARLQAIYPKAEMLLINSHIKEKSAIAACEYGEERLKSLRNQCYPQDIKHLSGKLKELEAALSLLRKESSMLSEEELPALIKEAASLQTNNILQGDFDLKIARQDYFTSNQNQVIEQLILQRSRNEFLTMALEVEAREHRAVHRLLTAVAQHLQIKLTQYRNRMKMLEDPILSPSKHQRGTIDSRDKATNRLLKVLDVNGEDQKLLYQTYAGLSEAADRLSHNVTSLRTSISAANSNRDDRLVTLEHQLKAVESLVYAGSSTVGGQPLLSPQPIIDGLVQLDSMMKKLESTILDIMNDIQQKKQLLKSDGLLKKERQLFVYFHTNPHKLRKTIDDITSRLQSMLVK